MRVLLARVPHDMPAKAHAVSAAKAAPPQAKAPTTLVVHADTAAVDAAAPAASATPITVGTAVIIAAALVLFSAVFSPFVSRLRQAVQSPLARHGAVGLLASARAIVRRCKPPVTITVGTGLRDGPRGTNGGISQFAGHVPLLGAPLQHQRPQRPRTTTVFHQLLLSPRRQLLCSRGPLQLRGRRTVQQEFFLSDVVPTCLLLGAVSARAKLTPQRPVHSQRRPTSRLKRRPPPPPPPSPQALPLVTPGRRHGL